MAWEGGGDVCTWDALAKKFLDRAIEISDGDAPALPSIIRYNERVVSAFSYISQLFEVPRKLEALEQRGKHKMLRLPPNSMSRELHHAMEPFSVIGPTSLRAWSDTALCRVARG